jgi:type VI secretion system secreted protein VgrG
MTEITQDNRFLSIETPLGANKLLLSSFTGREGISQLFNLRLDLFSEDGNINFDQIVGRKVTVGLKLADNETQRYFNGYVGRFAQLPNEGRLAHYHAEMVPWLWFLTRTTDCVIFQNQTIPEIIQQVFKKYGFSDYELQLRGNYQPWEYCVQYRETACNFVMRLMEQEGIFFFFKHEKGKHTLVMADSPAAHKPCPEQSQARYELSTGSGFIGEEDLISSWQMEHELRAGKYALNDYYFETPSSSLLSTIEGKVDQGSNKKYELYDYPGEYERRSEGDAWVRLRIEEEEAAHVVINGSGNCRSFVTGFRFDLKEHRRKDQNGAYVLTSITHTAHEGGNYPGSLGKEASYSNLFTCIPHAVIFRPLRITPRPLMQGCQTATVVGPAGEEIHTDNYGRVKVQFHWDRLGKRDENSSCWVRVSHPWAGKGWGAISIPRIGQEVIIDFLEGDPDQPIIVGRVYNAEQMPPWGLPGGKVVSGIKSNSTKGGSGYNEMSFDDTKGTELITIHGQYDRDTTIEHDERIKVGNDKSELVGHNETISIINDRVETVGGNETLSVAKNRTRTVTQNEVVTVVLTRTHSVGINEAITVGVNQEVTVGAMRVLSVGINQDINVGSNLSESVGKDYSEQVGKNYDERIGDNRTSNVGKNDKLEVSKNQDESVGENRSITVGKNDDLNVGKKICIEAGDQITLQTGSSKIVMKKNGQIEISGMKISITGSQSIKNEAVTINSEASGIHTVKGSLVKIN